MFSEVQVFYYRPKGWGGTLFGEGSQEALAWKEKMMDVAKHQGSLAMLDRLGECLETLTDDDQREGLENLREYLGKRIAMTDYPSFLDLGYDTTSAPL